MARTFFACIIVFIAFLGRADTPPIRPSFDPGRVGGREPESLRPRAQVVNDESRRQLELRDSAKRRQDLTRIRTSLKDAHEQTMRNLRSLDAKSLEAKSGLGAAMSEGGVKKEDVEDLMRNFNQTARTLQRYAAEMEKQQQGGLQ